MENKSNQIEGLWIPIEILSNQNLSANEKLVLSIIKALDKGQGCFASNTYIAKLVGLKSGTLSNMISSLKEKGFVEVEVEGYNTRTITYKNQLEDEPVEEEIPTEEVPAEEIPANVIPMKKKPMIWKGVNLSKMNNEAIERLKMRFPELVDFMNGKKLDESKPLKFVTNEELYGATNEVVVEDFASSNADVIAVESELDSFSKQLKLMLQVK